jgi:hypothetical protein
MASPASLMGLGSISTLAWLLGLGHFGPIPNGGVTQPSFSQTSTRRFLAFPSSVSLHATGKTLPYPYALIEAASAASSFAIACLTASARACNNI